MTALARVRHEAFAQGMAYGLTPEAAYRGAGYSARGHGGRLLARPEVRARVEMLRAEHEARRLEQDALEMLAQERDILMLRQLEGATRREIVRSLLRLAGREDLGGPAGVREARACLLEAFRLGRDLSLDFD